MGVTCNIQPLKNSLELMATIRGALGTRCVLKYLYLYYIIYPQNNSMKILYCPHFIDEDTNVKG